jgi:phenylacetate-CoA ligase
VSIFQGVAGVLSARAGLGRFRGDQQRVAAAAAIRLQDLLKFAWSESPFYRERLHEVRLAEVIELRDLPVLAKATMMQNLDSLFTDRRLDAKGVNDHIASGLAEDRYLGEYRIVSTSGSTGSRGLFVYSRREWSTMLATFLRWTEMIGMLPRPGRRRVAVIGAPTPLHMTYRLSSSLDFGVYKVLFIRAGDPTASIVRRMMEFRPDVLISYPSMCSMLAIEQLDERMSISPRLVATGGELLTSNMASQIQQAWGVWPCNFYALTELGLLGATCPEHRRMHLFNDLAIIEVVDSKYDEVPPGAKGAKLLLTNLFLRTQPLIRYEVSDMLTMSPSRCACGRGWPLVDSIDGRWDDLLWVRGSDDREVPIHPMQLQSIILCRAEVRAYQIVQRADMIIVHIVVDSDSDGPALAGVLQRQLVRKLSDISSNSPAVSVDVLDAIPRELSGKVRLVISDRSRLRGGT